MNIGFFIFMIICSVLLPVTMVCLGKHFINKYPKETNSLFGYRTAMSTQNKETVEFAQRYIGKIWYRAGIILIPVSLVTMMFVVYEPVQIVGKVCIWICCIQIIVLLSSIIPTEIALRKNFDKSGRRRP